MARPRDQVDEELDSKVPASPIDKKMIRNNLSYEILRREDGMIALSINAGRLPAKPLALELDAADGVVRSGRGDMLARFANLPEDLISYARESGGIELYEFGTFGLLSQHQLAWSGTP